MLADAIAAAEEAEEQLPGMLEKLRILVETYYPVEIITTLAAYGLTAGVTASGEIRESAISGIQQADVELFQGLMASISLETWGREIAPPAEVQSAIDTLVEARKSFATMRMVALGEERDEQERVITLLQERIRLHTQVVRNWGYLDKVMDVARGLLSPLDDQLREAVGFRATEAIAIYRFLMTLREDQYSERFQRLKTVVAAKSVRDAIYAYQAAYPDLLESPDDLISVIPSDASLPEVFSMLMRHSDLVVAQQAFVDVAEVSSKARIDDETIERVMAATCVVPQPREQGAIRFLFLDGPAWQWPGLLCGDKFLVVVPQLFFSHIFRISNRIFKEAGLGRLLEAQRADFLEKRLAQDFRETFPNAKVNPSKKWQWQGVQYETDLIVLIDRVLVIAEAKSAGLTPEGLRGAPDRLRRHVNDLVGAPAVQSSRLEAIVRASRRGDAEARRVTDGLNIDVRDIDTVIRLSVTLEDFWPVASLENELKAARWLDEGVLLPPTLSISDLEEVFELLEVPAIILHYLRERYRIQKSFTILGDELDCLGTYVKRGFPVHQEGRDALLQLVGSSKEVDGYFSRRVQGIEVARPRRSYGPWFDRLLKCLHDRSKPGWTTVVMAVLSGLDEDVARDLEARMDELRRSVPEQRDSEHHVCSLVWVPRTVDDDLVVYYIFSEADRDRRYERAGTIAMEQMEQHGRRRCIVIARKVERWDEPYSFFALFGDSGS